MSKLLSFLLLPLLVSSCSEIEERPFRNYHEIKDRLISWNDVFNQEEDYYLIYYYSERCVHCNDIKQDVLYYYFNITTSMYFVCTDYEIVVGPKEDLRGIDNVDDFYIFGTPFITEIKDHIVLNYYAGTEEILAFISI